MISTTTRKGKVPKVINQPVQFTATRVKSNPFMDDLPGARHYVVTLTRNSNTMSLNFSCGSKHPEPTAMDVLECLVSDMSFSNYDLAEFISEGTVGDGRALEDMRYGTVLKAKRILERIRTNTAQLLKLYTYKELQTLFPDELGVDDE